MSITENHPTSQSDKKTIIRSALKKEGKIKTFADRIKENPLQLIFFLAIIFMVLYLQVKLFVG